MMIIICFSLPDLQGTHIYLILQRVRSKVVLHGAGQCFMGEGGASWGGAVLQRAGSASGENGTAICTTVYPTFWRVFVGLLDLRVRLPHVLTCFRGVNGRSGDALYF